MEKYWWKNAVVYQIYPRSFNDSNGDGIGDIRGITARLDYIQKLGVNVIWLCPVYKSPMADNGYDISDYYHVDPLFGTDEDMSVLIRESGKRGIKIMMDMVINHTSDEHEWFKKALVDPEGPYGKYYFIRKGIDGNPPNNWRSVFGGSAWEPISGTPYYYLHLFAKKQVDLNWDNPELREEIYRMMNWWLDKGIAGFRMDAITYLKKEPGLPSFPPDAADGLVSVKYGCLARPGLTEILKELHDRTYGPRGAVTVGETAGIADNDLQKYISLKNGCFSMIFDFTWSELNLDPPNYFWYKPRTWTVRELKQNLFHMHEAADKEGWLGLCIENHDQPRSVERLLEPAGRNFYGESMLAVLYLFLRGTPYIYQGQEIGMRNILLDSIDEYDDCSSVNQYGRALAEGFSPEEALSFVRKQSRDNARTPFQWDGSANAGFSSGSPWLKVNENYVTVNASDEDADSESLLNFYRKIIRLRTDSPYTDVFTDGEMKPAFSDIENVVAYKRVLGKKAVLIIVNYQYKRIILNADGKIQQILCTNYKKNAVSGHTIELQPYEALIAVYSEADRQNSTFSCGENQVQ